MWNSDIALRHPDWETARHFGYGGEHCRPQLRHTGVPLFFLAGSKARRLRGVGNAPCVWICCMQRAIICQMSLPCPLPYSRLNRGHSESIDTFADLSADHIRCELRKRPLDRL